jgi:hypothetical protein
MALESQTLPGEEIAEQVERITRGVGVRGAA